MGPTEVRSHKTVRGTPLGGQEKITIKVIAVRDFLVQLLLLPTLKFCYFHSFQRLAS